MANNCENPCPYRTSPEISGVCPASGMKNQKDAIGYCAQVMGGRRFDADMLRLRVGRGSDPTIYELNMKAAQVTADETELPQERMVRSGVMGSGNSHWRGR